MVKKPLRRPYFWGYQFQGISPDFFRERKISFFHQSTLVLPPMLSDKNIVLVDDNPKLVYCIYLYL